MRNIFFVKVYAGTVLQPLPHLKADKMKSIANIVNCVLNPKFVNGIVSITTDALLRMEVGILDREGINLCVTKTNYLIVYAEYRQR